MNLIHERANGVAVRLLPKLPQSYKLDPALWLTLASLVAKLVLALYGCEQDDVRACRYAGNLGIIGRWRLRRIVRRHLKEDGLSKYTNEVAEACESEARGMFPSDISALRAEAQANYFGDEE